MWVVDGKLLASYLALVTLLMITPGPDMLFVLASGVRGGSRAGFVAAVGVAVGETVHLLAAAAGLAAVFQAAPALYDLVRFAGAGYLVWLGVRTLRTRGDGVAEGRRGASGTRRAFWRGMLTTPDPGAPSPRGAQRGRRQRVGVPRAGRQARRHALTRRGLRARGPHA